MATAEKILVVEDDAVVRKVLASALAAEGYTVRIVTNANDATNVIQENKPDLMILDLTLVSDGAFNGIIDGFSLLHWLNYTQTDADFPVIIHTVDTSRAVDTKATACKVFAVFRKGENIKELLKAVRRALDESKAKQAAMNAILAELNVKQ